MSTQATDRYDKIIKTRSVKGAYASTQAAILAVGDAIAAAIDRLAKRGPSDAFDEGTQILLRERIAELEKQLSEVVWDRVLIDGVPIMRGTPGLPQWLAETMGIHEKWMADAEEALKRLRRQRDVLHCWTSDSPSVQFADVLAVNAEIAAERAQADARSDGASLTGEALELPQRPDVGVSPAQGSGEAGHAPEPALHACEFINGTCPQCHPAPLLTEERVEELARVGRGAWSQSGGPRVDRGWPETDYANHWRNAARAVAERVIQAQHERSWRAGYEAGYHNELVGEEPVPLPPEEPS